MVQLYPQASFQQLMVRTALRGLYFLLLTLLSPRTESLVIVREPFCHELFVLLTDIIVGGAHSTRRTGVGRGRRRRGQMGFQTRCLSSGVGLFDCACFHGRTARSLMMTLIKHPSPALALPGFGFGNLLFPSVYSLSRGGGWFT